MKPYFENQLATIYNGDCREVLPTLNAESFDVLWTDPPYGHSNHDGDLNSRLNDHRGIENKPIANDSRSDMREVVDFVLNEAVRLLKPDCCCCCCCCCCGGGPKPSFAWLAERMDRAGLSFFHSVIWDKINPGLGWRFRRQHEMVMVAHRSTGKLSWKDDSRAVANIISASPPRNRLHPNEKPEVLVGKFLENVCPAGGRVIDPFMGSGTTLVAASARGLYSVGVELEEKYAEIAAKRMQQEVLGL